MRIQVFLPLAAALAVLVTGCATTKSLPASYIGGENKLSIQLVKIPAKPRIEAGSGGGGGLAAAIAASVNDAIEQNRLAKRMGEVSPDEVVNLIMTKVEKEAALAVPVVKEGNNLLMEIEVENWGWRRNTGLWVGPALAALSSTIAAKVSVYDLAQGKVKVGEATITGAERVGRAPEHEDLRRGLEMSAQDLADKIRYFLEGKKVK
ncbi:MAG TPA: hypothetical protein VM680_00400 [Verrucomicrobiae bacterium]|nr:hypothetical protein [Verrucomicrobiae bacterium]